MSAPVLITGGAGYLGRRIARRYLEASDREVALWVRARDAEHLAERTAELEADLGAASPRLTVVPGDLTWDDPFREVPAALRDRLGVVVHTAADIRFNVEAETADTVNVGGAEKVMRFAQGLGALERFGLLSSVYACGLANDLVEEARLSNAAGFANHYERSKWESEELLFTTYADLPRAVIRVATVVGDDDSGVVTQYNAVHNTFKLLFYGLVSLLPGVPDARIYLVSGRLAAEAAFQAIERQPPGVIVHATPGGERALTLDQLVDLVFARFQQDDDFKRRRILKPLLVDQESFDTLAGTVAGMSGEVVSQAVGSVAPFSQQLFKDKDVRNETLKRIAPDVAGEDPRALMTAVSDYLVRTRWGRNPDPLATPPTPTPEGA